MLEGLELFAYRKADHLVALTDAFKAHILAKGISSKKVTVIKNGADFSLYKKPPHGHTNLLRELGLEGKFVASYFGTHGMAHHLETVLEAARELTESGRTLYFFLSATAPNEVGLWPCGMK